MSTEYQVGDMTIHRIVEQEVGTRPAFQFLAGLEPELLEENRHWLEPIALLTGTNDFVFCFQSYVVKTPHHNVLIDSCIGNHKSRPLRAGWHLKNDDHYMNALAKANLRVEDIDYVMCTHLHTDHVGWNTKLENGKWVPTFPNARYLISKKELDYWSIKHSDTPIDAFADSVLPIIEHNKADLVSSSHVLSDHVRLLPTPGHTVDHFAVVLGKNVDYAVMTGDLIHSPLQARYPNLCASVDNDHPLAAKTRADFLERFCESQSLCCTAHFPSPSVGKLSRWGEGYLFTPE